MKVGFIGLGKMGQNMVKRLSYAHHEMVVFDASAASRDALRKTANVTVVESVKGMVDALCGPRVIWLMVPHGQPVHSLCQELSALLTKGDVVIDGGNSHFWETINEAKKLAQLGIDFIDVGVSGGLFGLDRGYCLMIGGKKEVCEYVSPIFKALAPGTGTIEKTVSRKDNGTAHEGYLYCGPSGAGHYVKMVHNAIEYGMMQSFAEGFNLLKMAGTAPHNNETDFDFSLKDIAEVWRRGSVVSSWLLDLLSNAYHKNETLSNFSGVVNDSGEGRWTLEECLRLKAPMPALADALFTRFSSRQSEPFLEKTLSALRNEFGGHSEGIKK